MTVDDEIPTVKILTPANCAYFNRTPIPIRGIAQDSISGVAKVEIDKGDGWVEAKGTTNWSFDFSPSTSETTYTITARVHDKAGNLFALPDTTDVKYYLGSPTANISSPDDGSEVSCIVDIMGSVEDIDHDYSDFSWTLRAFAGIEEPCSEEECRGTVIAQGNTPISESLLGRWDVRNLTEGSYTLCLTVKNNISEVHVRRTNIVVVKEPCILYGDVSGDGKITPHDADLIMKSIVGNITLNETQRQAADFTGDGTVSALDAAAILRKLRQESPRIHSPACDEGRQVGMNCLL